MLRLVSERMPESFGLLYEHDDEHAEPPGRDVHRVTVLTRGRLEERVDPFFSPYVPLLEGPGWELEADAAGADIAEYQDAIGLPAEFRAVELERSVVVGLECRQSVVELTVDFSFTESPRRGVVRWTGVTDLYWSGRVEGVLRSVAQAGELYRVECESGVLTLKAAGMEVGFGGTAGR